MASEETKRIAWRAVMFIGLGGALSSVVILAMLGHLSVPGWAWFIACAVAFPLGILQTVRGERQRRQAVLDDIKKNCRVVGVEGNFAILSSGRRVRLGG